MSLITSPEMFINMKSYPKSRTSSEYKAFWAEELNKVKRGVTINGVYIPGWLYWHVNHWKLVADYTNELGEEDMELITPRLRDNEWIFAEAEQRAQKDKQALCILGLRQFGKALRNDSLLYTESGEITIGECQIGDKIYDDSGELTTIVGKYPQGTRPYYKVTLLDGRVINCDENHLWKVKDRISKKVKVLTLKEMMSDYKIQRLSWENRKKNYEHRYYIPNNNCVNYPSQVVTIDPYVLGCWLGDGSSSGTSITNVDSFIIERFSDYGKCFNLSVRRVKDTYTLTSGIRGGHFSIEKNKVMSMFRTLNLVGNKHIPREYLYNSKEVRLELLRGLMDTDGSCDKNGTIEFSTTNEILARDFYKLCRSLGIMLVKKEVQPVCEYNGRKVKGSRAFRFNLFTTERVFNLQRKIDNQRDSKRYQDWMAITDISFEGYAETTCITVNNKSHLFLTDNYTVTHNTSIEASYAARSATINKNSQNIIVGNNTGDLTSITQMLDMGMLNVTPFFRMPRITRDWGSDEVLLGVKNKKGDNIVYSRFRIRNTQGGRNTETVAGTTIKCLIFDEIGKSDFLQTYNAAKPALRGPNGWRCVPILTGTGGSFEKSRDAEIMFFDPDSNDVLAFIDEYSGVKRGFFLPGTLRQDCKRIGTLAEYLGVEEGSELDIPMEISDEEKAMALIEEERAKAARNPDVKTLLKEKMYNPIKAEEVFLSDANEVFPSHLIDNQLEYLASVNYKPMAYVELFRDVDGIVRHRHTDKKPILHFPIKPNDNKRGVITIYEFPMSDAPFGLYIAGTDPYKQSKSHYSDSVGATYIYKRIHNILTEGFQDIVVASYVGRPADIFEWYENTKLLLEFYNAKTLCENMDYGFIQHCIEKNEAVQFLQGTPTLLREIHPNTKVDRIYGIHATDKIKLFFVNLIINYMKEVIGYERDEEGNVVNKILGVRRILDPLLLQELRRYDYGQEINTDRVVAFGMALMFAKELNKVVGKTTNKKDNRYKVYEKPMQHKDRIARIRNPFRNRKRP